MYRQQTFTRFCVALVLALLLSFAPVTQASSRCPEHGEGIVIRRTIPDPYAVKRSPLTSDRLSTTSTRLIDARRGFRPYSSVYGDRASHHRFATYDDHFGISRPENRPWSYSQRTPRTSVTQFRNEARQSTSQPSVTRAQTSPAYTLILREQAVETTPQLKQKIRIHNDKTVIPTTTGAVLIRADGTVIQIGD